MRAILVCGSRRLRDAAPIDEVLGAEHPSTLVLHGDAPGADCVAGEYFFRRGHRVVPMPAQWDRDGRKGAGPIRNRAMLDVLLRLRAHGYEVEVHAFPCPESRGTWHMVRIAKQAGVEVHIHHVLADGPPCQAGSDEALPIAANEPHGHRGGFA